MVEETKDLGGSIGGMAFAYGPVFDEIHIEMYKKAKQEYLLKKTTQSLIEIFKIIRDTEFDSPDGVALKHKYSRIALDKARTKDGDVLSHISEKDLIRLVESEVSRYKDIGISVREMSPEHFMISYGGPYSTFFSRVVKSHNRYLGLKKIGKLLDLMKNNDFYGVVYKITQVKDKEGKKITNGPVWFSNGIRKQGGFHRIGYSCDFAQRLKMYYRFAGDSNHDFAFENTLDRFKSLGTISESFKIEILAVCKTKRELLATEIFWQLYFNRLDNELGYDLSQNRFFNLIIGDLSMVDTIHQIKMKSAYTVDILNGLTAGAMQINRGDVSRNTVWHYLDLFFGTHNAFEILTMLIYPYLDNCFKRGYTKEEAYEYLSRSGFKMFDRQHMRQMSRLYNKMTVNTVKDRLLNNLLDFFYGEYTKGEVLTNLGRYELIRKKVYLKNFVEYLRGLSIVDITPSELISASGDLTIIEHLLVKDVSLHLIGDLVGISKGKVVYYLDKRWRSVLESSGIKFEMDNLRTFLKSNFLKMLKMDFKI